MKSGLPELRLTAVRTSVADILRKALLEGHFQAGESLSEVALATQLGVSRGPVREALLILSSEGLVTHSQNRGFAILDLTQQDLEEIQSVRLPLESQALSQAREHISKKGIHELELLKNKLLEAFSPGDLSSCVWEDYAFHSKLWEESGNSWLTVALRRIMAPYFAFTMAFRRTNPNLTLDLMRSRHELYLDYLRGECAQSAEECVRFHLA